MSVFPRDAYRGITRYAPDRRPADVDLSDNTNLRGPHPAALRVASEAHADALARYPSVYADDLRLALASRFGVPEESVVTGCGSDDLLDSAFRAACGPGGRIAHLVPTFSMIGAFAAMNGIETVPLTGWPEPPDPERLLDSDPALVYLCRPDNPTGAMLTTSWIERLLFAGGPDGPVVLLDEAYIDFAPSDARSVDFLRRAPGTDRLLVLRTFSKAYGLAGLRVGFAVGSPEVVREVEKSRGPYKVGRLAERAAVAALSDPEGWVPEVLREVAESRARLGRELERRGLRPLAGSGNFLLLPVEELEQSPRGSPASSDGGAATRIASALRARGVAVRPFPALPGIGDAIRVTVGPWPLLERFLQALDAVAPTLDPGSVP
jgi:histidinol-phosphate aminotransferase